MHISSKGLKQALTAVMLALLVSGCVSAREQSPPFRTLVEFDDNAIPTFKDADNVDAYLRAQERERAAIAQRQKEAGWEPLIIVTASKATEDVAITNTQVAGVDEGGIVKATREFLVILRRGRVHVVRHGDNTLETVSSIDAFPPDDPDPDDTWYDEMLLYQGMVIVIGYSYGEGGTEISRFDLSDAGVLTYRDTHYLNSADYYSSSNYASRLVDGTFYSYTPTYFDVDWRDNLPFLERRLPGGARVRVETTLSPSEMGMSAAMMVDPSSGAEMMHGITACDVLSEQLTCSTRTVLGTRASEYYFSGEAAYIWTGTGHDTQWGRASRDWGNVLYRLPFDRNDDVTAVSVKGDPVDQFSFHEDDETDSLFVLTVGDFVFDADDGFGQMMWESEYAEGEAQLLQIPLNGMRNGIEVLPPQLYRSLPEMDGRVQNRFVGRHLMVGNGVWWRDDVDAQFYITPLDERWVQKIDLPHTVSRLDRLGGDGVAIGADADGSLGFTAIVFDEDDLTGSIGSTYMLPAAEEGENRSQAFYWRADPDGGDGDGLMALPVDKELEGFDFYYLGSATAMVYLDRKGGNLRPVGELGSTPDANAIAAAEAMQKLDEAGECKASCTDWYGNSRPIFIGDRILALMGDQIIEGELVGGQIVELRRLNFTQLR